MKRHPNLILAAIFILLAAVGAVQGAHIRHLREAQAFYHWIIAAATNERLFDDWDAEYADATIYAQVQEQAPKIVTIELPVEQRTTEDGRIISQIGAITADVENNASVWDVARSPMLDDARQSFLQSVRNDKLQFAQNIAYADALSGNVNIYNLFLGFRKVAANFIWLQVDRYWHLGMNYRMLPLMRTVVVLDPNFVEAYLLGAWHLAYNIPATMPETPQHLKQWHPRYQACVGEKDKYYYLAADYLKSGIRNNPRNFRLYFDLGFGVYGEKLGDYPNSVKYLEEAVRQPHEIWVPRQLNIAYEKNRQYEKALAGWERFRKEFPEAMTAQEVAPRFILRNTALLEELRMEEALSLASTAANPEAAAQLEQDAEGMKKKALEIWRKLERQEPEYAGARILRIQAEEALQKDRPLDAIALLDQARWQNNDIFDEASEKIIRIKQQYNIPRTVSEQKWELREKQGEECRGMPEDAAAA